MGQQRAHASVRGYGCNILARTVKCKTLKKISRLRGILRNFTRIPAACYIAETKAVGATHANTHNGVLSQ